MTVNPEKRVKGHPLCQTLCTESAVDYQSEYNMR
jgi:hypothetical protein